MCTIQLARDTFTTDPLAFDITWCRDIAVRSIHDDQVVEIEGPVLLVFAFLAQVHPDFED